MVSVRAVSLICFALKGLKTRLANGCKQERLLQLSGYRNQEPSFKKHFS